LHLILFCSKLLLNWINPFGSKFLLNSHPNCLGYNTPSNCLLARDLIISATTRCWYVDMLNLLDVLLRSRFHRLS
jgi:hypothetical protein